LLRGTRPRGASAVSCHDLIAGILTAVLLTRLLRDPTRGALIEIAAAAQLTIAIDAAATPLRDEVRGLCEILGFDPLYLGRSP
jgi:hydrogenase expression/formation protein HypE